MLNSCLHPLSSRSIVDPGAHEQTWVLGPMPSSHTNVAPRSTGLRRLIESGTRLRLMVVVVVVVETEAGRSSTCQEIQYTLNDQPHRLSHPSLVGRRGEGGAPGQLGHFRRGCSTANLTRLYEERGTRNFRRLSCCGRSSSLSSYVGRVWKVEG